MANLPAGFYGLEGELDARLKAFKAAVAESKEEGKNLDRDVLQKLIGEHRLDWVVKYEPWNKEMLATPWAEIVGLLDIKEREVLKEILNLPEEALRYAYAPRGREPRRLRKAGTSNLLRKALRRIRRSLEILEK